MGTPLPSYNGWMRRDCGTWPRCREIPRSGRCWKQTGRRSAHARAVGSDPRSPHAKDLLKQWPVSHWQRFRLLEGHKGPLVADFLVLRAILPLDRLPGPEVWVVIRRKVSGSPE